ncbi:MAG: hypothetical protein ACJ780_24005 [Solirubrobacteraceae bacterium]|jgi:hypothetical protein
MTTLFHNIPSTKTAQLTGVDFALRARCVRNPVVDAVATGVAMAYGITPTDRNLHALAARCAG